MKIPEKLLYTDQHSWINLDGQAGTIGITDYAQDALSDIVYVETPAVGRIISKGEELGVIESNKAVVGLGSPVSGTILEANEALEDDPGLINADPYGRGWICKISLSDPAELSELMNASQYERFCGETS